MNEDTKPIRTLLENISSRDPLDGERRGYIRPKVMDRIAFAGSCLCVVLIATALVAMIWHGISNEFGLRCIGTVCVGYISLLTFRVINEHFV